MNDLNSNTPRIELLSLADIQVAASISNSTPLVKSMINLGSFVVLAGSSKAGKSALATNLCFAVANGDRFLGLETLQAPALWVGYEESAAERALLCGPYGVAAPFHHLKHPLPIDTKEGIAKIRAAIEISGAKLVVIDPLVAAVSCDGLSESVKARQALKPLNDLRIEMGITVVVLHHQNKGQHAGDSPDKMSDSHQIASVCTQFWNLSYRKKDDHRLVTLKGRGRHENGDKAWSIKSTSSHAFELATEKEAKTVSSKVPTRSVVLKAMEKGRFYTAKDLASATGQVFGTVQNAMKSLVDDKLVVATLVKGKKGNSYYLADVLTTSAA